MDDFVFCTPGRSPALQYASHFLRQAGFQVTSTPSKEVTHLLLPVPSFTSDGALNGGGNLPELLSALPRNLVIAGGNLNRQELEDYPTLDLLQIPAYLAQNANITAHCAIRLAMNQLQRTLWGCNVLVIGWGRIGKVLCKLLDGLGACVTVCTRGASDRALARALGYRAEDIHQTHLENYSVIFNTVPALLFPHTPAEALKIDLASQPGLGGADVIQARGLPGKDAPESAGALIAQTLLGILRKETL